ncbi:MAG: hypothetical protein MUC38_00245 [Cyclobacteriaceae bacterium]|jgi:hypothetical protein|nr:hypothetical protein [Cyclobacteriaceae bacterium]
MIVKIFRAVWFFSLLLLLALFFYSYAGWPDPLVLEESLSPLTISKDGLFYAVLACVAFTSVLAFVAGRWKYGSESFRSWLFGLITCFHLFAGMAINFISIFNSSEKFDFGRLAVLIYGSLMLMVVWAASWPVVYVLGKKKST